MRVQISEPAPRMATTKMHSRPSETNPQSEAKKLGIGKGTFHYLRKKARDQGSFRVYEKIEKKLDWHIVWYSVTVCQVRDPDPFIVNATRNLHGMPNGLPRSCGIMLTSREVPAHNP
jgi:hypothetical protein